jgi:hypothetical protein
MAVLFVVTVEILNWRNTITCIVYIIEKKVCIWYE